MHTDILCKSTKGGKRNRKKNTLFRFVKGIWLHRKSRQICFSEKTYFTSSVRNMFWATIFYKYHIVLEELQGKHYGTAWNFVVEYLNIKQGRPQIYNILSFFNTSFITKFKKQIRKNKTFDMIFIVFFVIYFFCFSKIITFNDDNLKKESG